MSFQSSTNIMNYLLLIVLFLHRPSFNVKSLFHKIIGTKHHKTKRQFQCLINTLLIFFLRFFAVVVKLSIFLCLSLMLPQFHSRWRVVGLILYKKQILFFFSVCVWCFFFFLFWWVPGNLLISCLFSFNFLFRVFFFFACL